MSYILQGYNPAVIAADMERICPMPAKAYNAVPYVDIATRYIDEVVCHLLDAEHDPDDLGVLHIFKKNIREKIKYKYQGSKQWFDVLNANWALYETLRNGYKDDRTNKAHPSKVRAIPSNDALLAYLYTNRQRIASYVPLVTDNYVEVPIDMRSLSNFIDNQLYYNSTEQDEEAYKRRAKNIYQGCMILGVAERTDGVLRQQISSTEWPRQHLTGINLQSARSEVREAALGKCYKYDINSCAFAFKAAVLKQAGYTPKHIMQLLHDKIGTRNMLAQLIMRDTNADAKYKAQLIKEAVTAMGFGSNMKSPFGEVHNIIWKSTDYKRFIKDEWILGFVQEQKLFTKLIKENFPVDYVKAEMPAALKDGKFSQSKLESYLFSQWETQLMQDLQQHLNVDYDNPVLLWVHDCVYLKQVVDLDMLNRIPQRNGFKDVSFTVEAIDRVNYNKLTHLKADRLANEQYQRIQHEEELARNYAR